MFAKSTFSSIAVYGLAGNDYLQVDEDVKTADYLFGGSGNDMLLGGDGADLLVGKEGRALLIAGAVDFQDPAVGAYDKALCDLMHAWNAPDMTYAARAVAVDAVVSGHVLDDHNLDVLLGKTKGELAVTI